MNFYKEEAKKTYCAGQNLAALENTTWFDNDKRYGLKLSSQLCVDFSPQITIFHHHQNH